ncbi:MAG TPA: hypothetical protein VFC22_01010 [Solirubrobacteraceae bacterium]|jgi:hypothetical protein|nr:hypothetical protein [Solirubrobacteraceae bacterium]
MTRNSYLRMRQASEAGLVSEILLRLSSEAKRTRAETQGPIRTIGRVGESAGERTRKALRDLELSRRRPIREP